MRLPIYVAGTLLGLIPRAALVAFAAARTEQFDASADGSVALFAAGLGATVLCFVVLVLIGKRALRRATAAAALS